MMLWKCCTQYASKFGKLSSGHRTGKVLPFIPIPKTGNAKGCSNYRTIALISHASKVILKILQARLQQNMNRELADVQAGFRKGRGTTDQIANMHWLIEKAREFQKKSTSALLTMPKPLIVWITTNCGKFLKRWEYQTTWPASWEICMQDKKQQLELDMEQHTGSKLGKEYVKAVYCHPAYLTYTLGVHWKDWCWSWNSNTLATWCEELTHWKRSWCWDYPELDYKENNAKKLMLLTCGVGEDSWESLGQQGDPTSQS